MSYYAPTKKKEETTIEQTTLIVLGIQMKIPSPTTTLRIINTINTE
jgi:hypothetical protein